MVKGVEVAGVAGDFIQPFVAGHPGSYRRPVEAVPVKFVQGFGGCDEGLAIVEAYKVFDKTAGQLAVAVAGQPVGFDVRPRFAEGKVVGRAGGGEFVRCYHFFIKNAKKRKTQAFRATPAKFGIKAPPER